MPDRAPSEVAAAYDRWARTYESDRNRTRELAAIVLRDSDLPIVGRAIIEVGCGTGHNTAWLAERAASVLALDFSEGMLREARSQVTSPRVRFARHDIQSPWPAAGQSADLVVAMLVFEHIEHLPPVFAEAARCLRPAGELFVCELHPARQKIGGRAEFVDPVTGEREQVPAFLHDISDFVDAGQHAGLDVVWTDERRDATAARDELPRLFSARFGRQA
jgi:ubiquinone/menaquinone biosynthesis C-methylase UbiE